MTTTPAENPFLFGRDRLVANKVETLLRQAEFLAIEKLKMSPGNIFTTQTAINILANELFKHLTNTKNTIQLLEDDAQELNNKINWLICNSPIQKAKQCQPLHKQLDPKEDPEGNLISLSKNLHLLRDLGEDPEKILS